MTKAILCIAFLLVFNSCATFQEQSKSPQQVQSDLITLAQSENIVGVENYFSENASLFPNGVSHGEKSEPCLFVGTKENCLTIEEFKRQYENQNETYVKLKSKCNNEKIGYDKLKCLTSFNSPCSGRQADQCGVVENKEKDMHLGMFEIKNPGAVGNSGQYTSDKNLSWYYSILKGNIEKANEQRKDDIAKYKTESKEIEAKNAVEEEKWVKYCKQKGIKAVLLADVQPISKFDDGGGVFSYVRVISQHCIGTDFYARFDYMNYCPGDKNSTCGVIYGLGKGLKPGLVIPGQFLAFSKKVKGADESGLQESDFSALKIINQEEIIKNGLK
ncbi:MAG: hypothetical protein H7235_04335 [Bdellovibrionaceae bacterium]|nr:hypothetical protein [Pseudobdellovibrionaceae bacterium]